MNKNILFAFIITFFYLTPLSAANYLKANYGVSSFDVDFSAYKGSPSSDEEDSGYSLSAGLGIGDNWGVDLMYYDLGTSSITGSAKDIATIDGQRYEFKSAGTISRDTSGYGSGIFFSTSNDSGFLSVGITGKLGFHYWDRDGSTDLLVNGNTTIESHFFDSGFDAYYGVGVDLGLTESLSINLSYDAMSFADQGFSSEDMGTLASLGITAAF